jgi:hypothetical protein|tara:strand:+ start:646 stop:1026 length:381 start_codon:yes stop_codon:yes gene_type:complete
MVGVKKDLYWHSIAKALILYGAPYRVITPILDEIFPDCGVTGRQLGAFKRRLRNENEEIPKATKGNKQEANIIAKNATTEEDLFIYKCSRGSLITQLEVYHYKMTQKTDTDIETLDDEWLGNLNAT